MNSCACVTDSVICLGKALSCDLPSLKGLRNTYLKDSDGKFIKDSNNMFLKGNPIEFEKRPTVYDVKVYSFPQTWGSTSLGFGGIGCAAMTDAQTTVVLSQYKVAVVYFGIDKAYVINNVNQKFFEDVQSHRMVECGRESIYER